MTLERRAVDDRINKIAEDVAYMRAKIEVIPELQTDVADLKKKAERGIGFLAGVAAIGGSVGAFISKFVGALPHG